MHRPAALSLCLLLACSGEPPATTAAPAPARTAAEPPSTDRNVVHNTTKSEGDAATARSPDRGAPAKHSGSVPGPVDPPWFKLELFPGATLKTSGRTAKDEHGLFSTQMLLALPAGTTAETCADTLTKALTADIPALTRTPKDDRITLAGANAKVHATMVCGPDKTGVMNAYVSYRWLTPPA